MKKFPRNIGGFEVLGSLGQGGMGVVYCARDATLERDLAIKVQSGDWQQHPEMMQRFLREARILARINHPNVVQIYSVGEHEGAPFFVMELLDGSVADAARQKKPSIRQLKRWMLESARGLAAIHEMGVIHRDIKPANLLLTRATSVEEEHVKVADLGIASSGEMFGAALTRAGAVLGTTGYLAPESFRPGHVLDSRADQYALGVVFYELLAGQSPHRDSDDAALLAALLEPRSVPDVRAFRPEVDASTAHILGQLLSDRPDQRFATTADLVHALGMVQEGSQRSVILPADPMATIEMARPAATMTQPAPPPPPPTSPPPPTAVAATTIRAPTTAHSVSEVKVAALIFAVVLASLAAMYGLYAWSHRADAPAVAASTSATTTEVDSTAPVPEVAAAATQAAQTADVDETEAGDAIDTESEEAAVAVEDDAHPADEAGAPSEGHTLGSLQQEAWAKSLLGRYLLKARRHREDWTMDLLEQDSGVISAELTGPERDAIALSGEVRLGDDQHLDGEDWEVYRLRLTGDADISVSMEIRFSDTRTAGEGSYTDGATTQRFDVEDSEAL